MISIAVYSALLCYLMVYGFDASADRYTVRLTAQAVYSEILEYGGLPRMVFYPAARSNIECN